MTKLTWIKWEPEAFLNGVIGLTAEEIGVYTIVLNLIYDSGGPIPDDARIARRCMMRPSSCEKVLQALAAAGKITREFGVINNARADAELKTRTKVVEKWKKNFSGSDSKVEKKANNNKEPEKPIGDPIGLPSAPIESVDSVEKNKIPSPNGEDAGASLFPEPIKQEAPDARVYRRGREVLGKNAGAMITKLLKAKGGNIALAMAALETASTKNKPTEYIGGVVAAVAKQARTIMEDGDVWRDNLV